MGAFVLVQGFFKAF